MTKILILTTVILLVSCNDLQEQIDSMRAQIEQTENDVTSSIERSLRGLPEDLQDKVLPVFQEGLNKEIGFAAIEAKCGLQDAIRMALNELERVEVKLGWLGKAKVIVKDRPLVYSYCQPSMSDINFDTQSEFSLRFLGYNMQKEFFKVMFEDSEGNRHNVSSSISQPSSFLISLPVEDFNHFGDGRVYLLDANNDNELADIHARSYLPEPDIFYDGKLCGRQRGYNPFHITCGEKVKKLREIRIWSGTYVDAIQLIWQKLDGAYSPSTKTGGGGGTLRTLSLGDDHYVKSITVRGGSVIDNITIQTNRTTMSWGGGGGDWVNTVRVPAGQDLYGFHGGHGRYRDHEVLSSIGPIFRTNPE